jgi:hypothetical protein
LSETALALKCFVAGVTGVFMVMALLQIMVMLSSKLAIWIEAKTAKKSNT